VHLPSEAKNVTQPPDLTQRLRAWSYRRQLLDRTALDPAEALRHIIAVYSTHPTAPLSLHCRTASFAPQDIAELEQRREVVRIPAMRGSIFLAPLETAARLAAATRRPLENVAPNLRYAGLDPAGYAALKPRILALTQEPTTADALKRAIPIEGRLTTAVHLMAREGLLLRLGSSLRTDNLRYVATDAWLGRPLDEADPTDSLRWLAESYLRAFGPARVADFAWWSGVPIRRAREALAGCDLVDVSAGLLLPANQHDVFAAVEPIPDDTFSLLPKWDAYTMGHAPDGRQRLIPDPHLGKAFTLLGKAVTAGDGLPLLLRGGRAVASWSHRFAGDRMLVTVKPFAPDALPALLHVERGFDEVGRLLGAAHVEVVAVAAG
jgi:hypothetical protein